MPALSTTMPVFPGASESSRTNAFHRVAVLDSHTGGEPTRLVLSGGPDLGQGPLTERLHRMANEFPGFRTSVLAEPRGSDVLVGALLCEPHDPASSAGVLFFNDVGYLGMCGHGTIGLMHSLAYLGKLQPGDHVIETPVGLVEAILRPTGEVEVSNVPSYRLLADLALEVEGFGRVVGDVCWGGNWFFLISTPPPVPLTLDHVGELTRLSTQVRRALQQAGIYGRGGALVDHIEWFSAPLSSVNHSRNFVLCPGAAYDRSPCGTGTSAKLASLAARQQLGPEEEWRQEGILGTVFTSSYRLGPLPGMILPRIMGRAYVMAESTLLFESQDPFREGIAGSSRTQAVQP